MTSRRPHRPLAALLGATFVLVSCNLAPGRTEASGTTTLTSERLGDDQLAVTSESVGDGQVALTYADVTGADRRILVEVRRPDISTETKLPVVVWSHGGGSGKRNPSVVGRQWGRAFNRAGVAFVAIAHVGRTDEEREALCTAVGAPVCEAFSTLSWDRPNDAKAVFDWIDTDHEILGVDPRRLVYGGHSGGAKATLTTAGMDWVHTSQLAPPTDPRPVAFVAASPIGAEPHGLTHDSFAALDRPVLLMTGAGDTTSSTTAAQRRATFDLLPSSPPNVMLWIDRESARHGVFNLNDAACRRTGESAATCRRMVRLIAQVASTFVTAAVSDTEPTSGLRTRFRGHLPSMVSLRSSEN